MKSFLEITKDVRTLWNLSNETKYGGRGFDSASRNLILRGFASLIKIILITSNKLYSMHRNITYNCGLIKG